MNAARRNSGMAFAVLVLGLVVAVPATAQHPLNPQLQLGLVSGSTGPFHWPFYNVSGNSGDVEGLLQAAVEQTGAPPVTVTSFLTDLTSYWTDPSFAGAGGAGPPGAPAFLPPGPPDCPPGRGLGPNCLRGTLNVPTPEPGSLMLLASGLAGLAGAGLLKRRRRGEAPPSRTSS